jgi:serine/threonine-protein kinase
MSPEQKAGKDVTVRSDLYSLGLVLHEMFTGKARKDTQSSPSEIVKDLDPAIERLILRCLEDDSKRRPSSALNVAMALPGADPIAAALAAGETPSPEMVAASHEKEGLSSRAAVICFIAVVLATAVISVFAPNNHLLSTARLDIPPDGLANHAQGVLRQLGYTDQPASTAYGFDCCDRASLAYANGHARQTRDAILASHRPPVLRFWYRQHQDVIYQEPTSFILRQPGITFDAPPNTEPGMVRALFDPLGRLLALEARPFRNRMDAEGSSAPAFDWSRLFSAAGLDPASFVTRTPQQLPPMPFDAHMSWAGVYGPARSDQVHVEAAAWQGRPVYFLITGADAQPTSTSGLSVSMGATGVIAWAGLFAFLFICVGAGLLARHNLRAGRGDRKGAARVAAVYMACAICAWILTTSHVARPSELGLLLSEIGRAGVIAGLLWLGYIAVEPFMRRHWPESLISWNRLHSGHIRDPLLASHVLTGIAVWSVLYSCVPLIFRFVPVRPPERLSTLDSPSDFGAYLAMLPSQMLSGMVALLVMVVALRVLARRRVWIADILASLLFALTPGTPVDFSTPLTFAMTYTYVSFMTYAIIWLIRRFGFVAMLFAWMGRILIYPVVFGTWFTGQSLIPLLIPVVIAGWALWVIVSDQRRLSTESNA